MKSIREIRMSTGLSQTEFGKRLGGIPLRTIQNWENGVRVCPDYVVELIAFRVEHDENLLTAEEKEHRRENLEYMRGMLSAHKEYKDKLESAKKEKE